MSIKNTKTYNDDEISTRFLHGFPSQFAGGFLMFNAIAIGLLWLSAVDPPGLLFSDIGLEQPILCFNLNDELH